MKEMLNLNNPKIYAEMFISRIPKNAKRILMYGISDKRTIEIILDSFPKAEFVIADREANYRLLRHSYPESKKYHYINTTDDEKDLTILNEEGEIGKMPKFDVAIMNPPYSDGKENKNIDLRIISLCVNLSHKCIAIAPSAAITDFYRILGEGEKFGSKADYNNKANAEYKTVCETNLKEFINVSTNEANEMFGTTIQTKMAIFVFNDDTSIKPINTMDLVEHNSIFDKIVKPLYNGEMKSILSAAENTKKTKFGCELREHHGNNIGTLNYYEITARNFEDACFTNGKSHSTANGIVNYYVDTEKELKNFFDYVNCPVIKYIHSLTKTNMRTRRQFIPDFGTYKKHITYKMIVDKFGITGYISDDKAKKGSEWEIILKAIK